MANTRDTLGDQATLDGLINHTLTSIEEDGVLNIRKYALCKNTVLQTVDFPSVKTIGERAFESCEGIEEIIFPEVTSIGQYAFLLCLNLEKATFSKLKTLSSGAFSGCQKLNALILGNTSGVVSLTNQTAFSETAIYDDKGWVYVPTSLVASYKSSSSWGGIPIADINEYPKAPPDFSEITDSWSEIFAAEEDGTYSIKYSVGRYKSLTINNTTYHARIVAMDADELSDNSGNAKITWIVDEVYADTHNMNSNNTASGGWPATEMRAWLRTTILPLIDSTVSAKIKEVNKTYKDPSNGTQTFTDTIWIPSVREMSDGAGYENSGVTYKDWFNKPSRRARKTSGSIMYWWLRTSQSSTNFRCMSINGNSTYSDNPNKNYGVVIGFCT